MEILLFFAPMKLVLFDDLKRSNFLPLVFTRPVSELRIGIQKISEKWKNQTGHDIQYITDQYLSEIFQGWTSGTEWYANGRVLPSKMLVEAMLKLAPGSCMVKEGTLLAARVNDISKAYSPEELLMLQQIEFNEHVTILETITDLFMLNGDAIKVDFSTITQGRKSAPIHESTRIIGPLENLFVEEGVMILASVINTTTGPVYIGKNAEVMEGSLIRGPFALCEGSSLKMGSKVYGPVTIGPHSKIGGEISVSVIQGYSNKAHDGFLGHSIIGEWCNLGADTNNSNLKNNYSPVKIWNYQKREMVDTGLVFCGLIMGDHSKCGINTMFNTGTVVGVCANIFGGDFIPKHVASFTWGMQNEYEPAKAFETIQKVMGRRNQVLTVEMERLLTEVYRVTSSDRLT